MVRSRSYLVGVALVTMATLMWSSAGLFMRSLDLDLATIQVWRALFGALSLFLIILGEHGRRAPQAIASIGPVGFLVAVPLSAISMLAFVVALKLTTVANVMIVYATVPFLAAGVAFVWVRERPERRVVIASCIALAGVVVMAGGAARGDDIVGSFASFVMTATFAVLVVMARRFRGMPMAPINAVGGLLCAALAWPFAGVQGLPSLHDLVILAAFGSITTGLAYLLFLTGSRRMPSSEAGLIALLDVILGPTWVWLAFGERPSVLALVGGALVLGALVWYLARGLFAAPVGGRQAAQDGGL